MNGVAKAGNVDVHFEIVWVHVVRVFDVKWGRSYTSSSAAGNGACAVCMRRLPCRVTLESV